MTRKEGAGTGKWLWMLGGALLMPLAGWLYILFLRWVSRSDLGLVAFAVLCGVVWGGYMGLLLWRELRTRLPPPPPS